MRETRRHFHGGCAARCDQAKIRQVVAGFSYEEQMFSSITRAVFRANKDNPLTGEQLGFPCHDTRYGLNAGTKRQNLSLPLADRVGTAQYDQDPPCTKALLYLF